MKGFNESGLQKQGKTIYIQTFSDISMYFGTSVFLC